MIIMDDNQRPRPKSQGRAGTTDLQESTETPLWGPPGDPGLLPESPETPPWGPPQGGPDFLPESPDTPSWGPPLWGPDTLPESPDTPSWGPPPGGAQPWPPIILPPLYPNHTGACNVRFLYAAVDRPPVNIQIDRRTVIRQFQYANVTPYYLESAGNNKIIVLTNAATGAVLYRAQFTFLDGYAYTMAIVNNGSGISLISFIDDPCRNAGNMGCLRAVNLSPNSGPVDIFLTGVGRVFRDIGTYESSAYRRVYGRTYRAFVTEALPCANDALVTLSGHSAACNHTSVTALDAVLLNLRRGVLQTLYIIGLAYAFPALQILAVESDLVY